MVAVLCCRILVLVLWWGCRGDGDLDVDVDAEAGVGYYGGVEVCSTSTAAADAAAGAVLNTPSLSNSRLNISASARISSALRALRSIPAAAAAASGLDVFLSFRAVLSMPAPWLLPLSL